ncbi:uncharacterized protein EV420DRAFT_1495458 [Desarmillaria tabescens]|uniref:Small RNA 2'-O-methyltransferase n=1 Tax=Armillaria tabescens TaxID=1929756 RepID=A0AA39NPT4_ARMTA|nr:uncharacterized protein EV420DRAFT_1495458 [Desarmillaria tabescens]KAK0469578.1 hypothetical protein EV420DRAFT_1495458 [Desarmillaria tabescens]
MTDHDCTTILEEDRDHELFVTFNPPLYLQRKIWILDVMRRDSVTDVVDIGCGEGQLLSALCQPAPWLGPPPPEILPPSDPTDTATPNFNSPHDPIPNLHPVRIAGLDISQRDLDFAIQATAPPPQTGDRHLSSTRWEPLVASIWKGGLEVINESFVGAECIVSSEVIEHLPSHIFLMFAPMLLGVYHPKIFLVTTPSYTFNARFTSPNAPPSVRKGYPDPTGRTNRIFRHDDHKFEWTIQEFHEWCKETAERWGYEAHISDVGRATEKDEWGRDEELGGATLVTEFRRLSLADAERSHLVDEARKMVESTQGQPHQLLAEHRHVAHPQARQPIPVAEIGKMVKAKMEEGREGFMRFETLWYDKDIGVACGGFTEVLINAIQECEGLVLKREGTDDAEPSKWDRDSWHIELIGGSKRPKMLWPAMEEAEDTSFESVPPDWLPNEESYSDSSSDREWGESTGAEGDVSWNNSEDDTQDEDDDHQKWGSQVHHWATDSGSRRWGSTSWGAPPPQHGSSGSTTGWDGDESDDTHTF